MLFCFSGAYKYLAPCATDTGIQDAEDYAPSNIFLSDDMARRGCQPYGNKDVYTPNL